MDVTADAVHFLVHRPLSSHRQARVNSKGQHGHFKKFEFQSNQTYMAKIA